MTLSVATMMISVRMMNITFRSTTSAEKKVSLRCRQSTRKTGRSAAAVISGRIASTASGSSV